MEKHLDGTPIALFGHSMGTLFTYELAHSLHQVTGQSPAHLFFSGRGAPHTAKKGVNIHELPDAEFQNEVLQLGGTPLDLFANKELSDIYMPILRSDYRLVETYQDTGKEKKLDCDITILWGNRDRYTREEAEDWGKYTNGDSRFIEYNGGHFFINEQPQKVIDAIHASLLGQRSIIHQ
jgi:medium-chain acyl-[acyl-carrier-protein] hydrolase